MIEYSEGYLADHWCQLGHLVFVLEGELINEHEDGRVNVLKAGMSYHVSDGLSSHPSRTEWAGEDARGGWGVLGCTSGPPSSGLTRAILPTNRVRHS